MIKLTVQKSKRLELMMSNETWLMRLYREFALRFSKAWNKEAGSDREWIKTGGTRTGNFGFVKTKPHPTKLTVRSGRLIAAALGKSEQQNNVTVRATGFELTKTLTVPYANRQEWQLGGQRAYMLPSAQYVRENLGDKVLQDSLKEVLK